MNNKILILLFSIFLDILSFSFLLPIIPFLVEWLWGNSSNVWMIVSWAAIWMLIWWVVFGRLSDKYWRKKILLITILLNIVGYLLFAVSTNLKIFFIARFICWLWWWWVSVVQAHISEISDEKSKIINMWYVWAAVWLWFTLWPIFGSLMSSMELKHMWFISALILIISFTFILLFLPDSKIKVKEEITLRWIQSNLLILFILYWIVTTTFSWIQTIFTLFLKSEFAFTAKNVWYVFWFMWIVSIFYQIYWIKYAYAKLKEYYMIISGLFLVFIWAVLIWFNTNVYLLFFLLILIAVWLSNINSAIFSKITSISHKKDFGKNLWLNTAFWSTADIVWPLISGNLFLISSSFPFYFFWILIFLVMIVFSLFKTEFNK